MSSADNVVFGAEFLLTAIRFVFTTIAFSAFRAVMLRAGLECTRHVCCRDTTSDWKIVVAILGQLEYFASPSVLDCP